VELESEIKFAFLAQEYNLPGAVQKTAPIGSGHIHDTYLVECADDDHSRFVLQKFNHHVFSNPQQVASNIWLVLEHIVKSGSSSGRQPLRLLKTKDDGLLFHSKRGDYWRLFNYIPGSDSVVQVTHPDQAYGAASAFGNFINLLTGLDPQLLFTTIPDFHNLRVRFGQLTNAIVTDQAKRVAQYTREVEFATQRETRINQYFSLANNEEIPLRITHNDTKISNVLFKRGTTSAICVIDLDTVMPGLLLYDFGDMARTFCNSVLEDQEAEQAEFNLGIFKALCLGFFKSIRTALTQGEIDSLKVGPWWMTYIMGIRFLTDFLLGDIYYKTSYPRQNLYRARNQFRLLSEIENKQDDISEIINVTTKSLYS